MNVITNLYETPQQWKTLAGRCIEGSNQLENMPTPETNYSTRQIQRRDKGFYGALVQAVEAGINKAPLTLDILEAWSQLILEEMHDSTILKQGKIKDKNKEKLIQSLIDKININLSEISENRDKPKEIATVSLMSDIIFEIESIHLFAPFQRKICHLIVNYLMSYLENPIIVLTPKDRDTYLSSIDNKLKLKIFLSEKFREAVFYNRLLLHKVGGEYTSEWYKHEDSPSEKDLIIEWHELFKAVRHWKEELEKETKHALSSK